MPADEYYDNLNHKLAGDEYCDRESTESEALEAIAIGAEQEEILEASRSVRAGTDLLLSALRKAGAL